MVTTATTPAPAGAANCWIMWRDGAPYGSPGPNRRSLLIGYDMMPLRGLEETAKVLAERGILPYPTLAAPAGDGEPTHATGVLHGGVPVLDFLNWTSTDKHAAIMLARAAGWLSAKSEHARKGLDSLIDDQTRAILAEGGGLRDGEDRTLSTTWLFHLDREQPEGPRDKRRLPTLARLRAETTAILARHGLTLGPITYRRVAPTPN